MSEITGRTFDMSEIKASSKEVLTATPEMLEFLKCPCCKMILYDNISICAMGHSACDPCSRHLQNCPTCGMLYTGGRNFALENLLSCLTIDCCHKECGRKLSMTVRDYIEHEQVCPHRIRKCFSNFGRQEQCDWEGKLVDMPDHFRLNHSDLVHVDEESTHTWDFYNNFIGVTLVANEYFLVRSYLEAAGDLICFAMVPANLAYLQEKHKLLIRQPHTVSGSAHTWELDFDHFKIQHGCFQDAGFLDEGQDTAIASNYDVCLTQNNFPDDFCAGLIKYRVKIKKPQQLRNVAQYFIPMS